MGDIDINLILQIVLLIIGAVIAWMVRKGWIDRKTIEDTKDIAEAATHGLDKLKDLDADVANVVLREVVSKIGVKKDVLDAFLQKMNLNKPGGGDGKEGEGG